MNALNENGYSNYKRNIIPDNYGDDITEDQNQTDDLL